VGGRVTRFVTRVTDLTGSYRYLAGKGGGDDPDPPPSDLHEKSVRSDYPRRACRSILIARTPAPVPSEEESRMTISRRDAIAVSGSAIVGLSVGGLDPKELAAQVAGQEQEFPDRLIDVEPAARHVPGGPPAEPRRLGPRASRVGRRPDPGPPHVEDVGPQGARDRVRLHEDGDPGGHARAWHQAWDDAVQRPRTPDEGFAHLPHAVRCTGAHRYREVDRGSLHRLRGHARPRSGRPLLPLDRVGRPLRGRVRGGVAASAGHARLDDEEPLDPQHGAPLRLVMPFRYGNRSIKAITEIIFGTPGLPRPGTG